MTRTKALLALPVALSLWGTAADAKQPNRKKEQAKRETTDFPMARATQGHQPHDLNGDGVVSRKEWPGSNASFAQLDRDGNGILDDRDRGLTSGPTTNAAADRPSKGKAQKSK